MMGAQKSSCRALSLSNCSLVAWRIDDPVFELMCGYRWDGDASCQLWGFSMRERGMGVSGGKGMFTRDLLYGGDGIFLVIVTNV